MQRTEQWAESRLARGLQASTAAWRVEQLPGEKNDRAVGWRRELLARESSRPEIQAVGQVRRERSGPEQKKKNVHTRKRVLVRCDKGMRPLAWGNVKTSVTKRARAKRQLRRRCHITVVVITGHMARLSLWGGEGLCPKSCECCSPTLGEL